MLFIIYYHKIIVLISNHKTLIVQLLEDRSSHKCEPLSWVVCEYGVDGVSTDSSLLHLGHYVLQQVPVPVTSIANLHIHKDTHTHTHTGACANAELCNYGKSTLLILIVKSSTNSAW